MGEETTASPQQSWEVSIQLASSTPGSAGEGPRMWGHRTHRQPNLWLKYTGYKKQPSLSHSQLSQSPNEEQRKRERKTSCRGEKERGRKRGSFSLKAVG